MLKHWIDHIKSNIWITRPTPSIAVLSVIIHGIGILIVAWIHVPKDTMHLTKNPNPSDKTPKSCNMLEAAVPKLALTAGVLKNETTQEEITEKGSLKTSKYALVKLDIISNQAISRGKQRGPKTIFLLKYGL